MENCGNIYKITAGVGKTAAFTKFEISVNGMSVFSWSLFNQTKIFGGIGKIVALRDTILPTHFLLNAQKRWGTATNPKKKLVLEAISGIYEEHT